MVQMIKGCGIEVEGAGGFVCGDSIDTDYDYETETQYIQPILCDKCWDIQREIINKQINKLENASSTNKELKYAKVV